MSARRRATWSILDHPEWARLAPNFRLEVYGRDGGPDHPRVRIEVTPLTLSVQALLAVTMPCVHCGISISPIRARGGRGSSRGSAGHLYFAATCRLDEDIRCSRSDAARVEYARVRAEIEQAARARPPVPTDVPLF